IYNFLRPLRRVTICFRYLHSWKLVRTSILGNLRNLWRSSVKLLIGVLLRARKNQAFAGNRFFSALRLGPARQPYRPLFRTLAMITGAKPTTMNETNPGRVKFGPFEADLYTHEIWKYGVKIKLVGQPFEVLAILLDKPGELVTREELHERLWSGD